MCTVKGCGRQVYVEGLCGLHALQRHYRVEPTSHGLAVARVKRPPAVLGRTPQPRRSTQP
jgi:hypothetical protein